VEYVVDNVAMGQAFSECFGFPCQFPIQEKLHFPHLTSEADTMGYLCLHYQFTQSHPNLRVKTKQKYSLIEI
jgi:hypothetical protein